jgi:excisionase family DNA binding protein
MTTKPEPLMLTVKEVMDRARVCKATVHNWLREGHIPKAKIGGRTLVSREALDKMLGLESVR